VGERGVVQAESARTLGSSLSAGAFFGSIAFAFVVVLDAASTAFVAELDFVLSATAAAVLAGGVLWWRAVERHGECTRRRGATVGAVVGFVGPTLAFALNPSVYGSNPNVALDVVGGIVAAGILGLSGHLSTYGLPVILGAVAGWSLAGWVAALKA
jgi:hypothetical protein